MSKTAKTLLRELSKRDKLKVMFYLNEQTHTNFKKICKSKGVKMSELIEKLIQNFLEEVTKGEKNG